MIYIINVDILEIHVLVFLLIAALLSRALSLPALNGTYIDGIAFAKVHFQFRQVGHVVENGQNRIAEVENFLCRQLPDSLENIAGEIDANFIVVEIFALHHLFGTIDDVTFSQ